jgi:FMN phosphatase YigB (HAD superfamily)
VLLFDFDGTVSLGAGPAIRYAECVADTLPARHRAHFLGAVTAQKTSSRDSLYGPLAPVRPASVRPIDDYDAVRLAASAFSVPAETLGQAYRRSRGDLASARAPIEAVPGLPGFLAESRAHARLVLATNSPDTRISEALAVLGLGDAFDEVITSVGKPAGLASVLEDLRSSSTARALRLLSIGDVWANDLQPAQLAGFQTALIGAAVPFGATPTYRAQRLDELFPVITAWLSAPAASACS